jgi:hypothetical protein
MPLLRPIRRILIDRTPFRLPFRKAAVQHGDIVMAEDAEHPPGARGREKPRGFIDNDFLAIADPELLHARGEFLGSRQHVGQGGLAIGDVVDVEELCSRDAFGQEFGLGVALRRR